MTGIYVVGAGGHAKVLISTLSRAGRMVTGLLDRDERLWGQSVLGVPVLGDDRVLAALDPTAAILVNGLGDVGARAGLFERMKTGGWRFQTVIDPSAVIADSAELGEGVQVLAGSVVQACTRLGDNVIINNRASIDHDCEIGAHSHIAPGAVLAGSIRVGSRVLIGAGAAVRPMMDIGDGAVIGVGAAVVGPVGAGQIVAGVPARPIR